MTSKPRDYECIRDGTCGKSPIRIPYALISARGSRFSDQVMTRLTYHSYHFCEYILHLTTGPTRLRCRVSTLQATPEAALKV